MLFATFICKMLILALYNAFYTTLVHLQNAIENVEKVDENSVYF